MTLGFREAFKRTARMKQEQSVPVDSHQSESFSDSFKLLGLPVLAAEVKGYIF